MKKPVAAALSISIALSGCATASKDIASNYVSPMQYQSYNCDQLAGETQRIQVRVNQVGGRLDEAAEHDKQIAGVGIILFWPALFALGGTKQQEADYSRLKGEYDAVQQAAIAQKCTGVIAPNQTVSAPSPQNNSQPFNTITSAQTADTSVSANTATETPRSVNAPVPQKLRELQVLRKDGVITEDEFQKKKQQLLEKL